MDKVLEEFKQVHKLAVVLVVIPTLNRDPV